MAQICHVVCDLFDLRGAWGIGVTEPRQSGPAGDQTGPDARPETRRPYAATPAATKQSQRNGARKQGFA